jgi:hypothetical protein
VSPSSKLYRPYTRDLRLILASALKQQALKAADYDDEDHPLRTLRLGSELGVAPWRGALLRLSDKISLLLTFVQRGRYVSHDESFRETILDIITYAAFALLLYEQRAKFKSISFDDIRAILIKTLSGKRT